MYLLLGGMYFYKNDIRVGNTPLVELVNLRKEFNLQGKIFGKLESKNPAGSVKDRIALQMILGAEEKVSFMKAQ